MYRVLLVDDEELERTYLRSFLADDAAAAKYLVVGEAASGREAIVLSEQLSPDIIFMDIKMPGIDGLEATQKIKNINPGISCIILTAYDDFTYAQKAIRAGADDYLLKPAMANEIISVLGQLKQKRNVGTNSMLNNLEHYQREYLVAAHPYEKEAMLVKSLQTGDIKLLNNCFKQYLDELFSTANVAFIIKARLLELNTLVAKILISSDYERDTVLKISLDNSRSLISVESKNDIISCMDTYKEAIQGLIANGSNNLAKTIIKYINANHANNISVESIAQYFHFSPSYISRLIKKATGVNYSDFIHQIRLNHAKLLLKNSSLNIYSIARQVGYTDISNFNRVFKKVIGISPSKYRKIFFDT